MYFLEITLVHPIDKQGICRLSFETWWSAHQHVCLATREGFVQTADGNCFVPLANIICMRIRYGAIGEE